MQNAERNKIGRFLRKMKAFLATRDALIFLFFLICSAIFWLTITLNKTYELSVEFPIEYVNIPPELEFTTELPSSFSVKLKDKGTSMLIYQYKNFPLPKLSQFLIQIPDNHSTIFMQLTVRGTTRIVV